MNIKNLKYFEKLNNEIKKVLVKTNIFYFSIYKIKHKTAN